MTGAAWAPVYRAACSFRGLLQWFGAQQLMAFSMRLLPNPAVAAEQAVGPGQATGYLVYTLVALVVLVITTIAMLIQVYRLASATGSRVAVLWVLGMLLPFLNLLFLLALNSNAKKWLEKRGVAVGFLGPNQQTIANLALQAQS